MNNIICSECNTENEPQYTYCKNCGKKLVEENKQNYNQANFMPYSTYKKDNETHNTKQIVDNIGPLPIEDVETYIGKKSSKFLPKFSRMEITGSKISWCWPAAIFGYLFGPLGAAIWFFYRKMYKIAFVLVAIGVLLNVGTTLLAGNNNAIQESVMQQIENGTLDIYEIIEGIDGKQTIRIVFADFVDSLINVLTMILCGLFSFNIYKNSIIKNVEQYKAREVDSRYYRMGLVAIGGTSTGMAILGFFIVSLVTELCTIISMLVF